MNRLRRAIGVGVAVATVIAFLVFVWPTGYRTIVVAAAPNPMPDFAILGARENRFTGQVDVLVFPNGWVAMGGGYHWTPVGVGQGDSLRALARRYSRPASR